MPSFKSTGKSRDDLALVAQLAGLVSAEAAAGLSRAELVKIITRAEAEANRMEKAGKTRAAAGGAAETPALERAPRPRGRPRVKPVAASEPAQDVPVAAAAAVTSAKAGLAADQQQTGRKRGRKPSRPAELLPSPENAPVTSNEKPVTAAGTVQGKAKPGRRPGRKPGSRTIRATAEPVKEAAAELRQSASGIAVEPAGDLGQPAARTLKVHGESAQSGEDAFTSNEQQPEFEQHRMPAGHILTVKRPVDRQGRTTRTVRTFGQRKNAESADEQSAEDYAAEQAAGQEFQPAELPVSESAGQGELTTPVQGETDAEAARPARPQVETGDLQAGVLEIMPDGYGFLRKENYLQGNKDIYVPPQYIRRFGLRPGDHVTGLVKLQRETDRYQALLYIKEVNGFAPEKMLRRVHFDRLTPIYPTERFILETTRNELSTRIIDLVAPIGKGQRGMIVSPPKAGKTILLQKIANAISTNNPDVKLIVLLIDERPEEVTDMQRSINGEVVYSTFDKTPENHTKVTELVLERAMRLVELKYDVVILLDSMTRLARAYNLSINPTGRTLSGGLDPGALYGPKRFFGAARNIENGGSLTIIATSLIETGSRMDEVIFEEFKGTGNMEVYLDRKLSEKRIFPAIDINKSGTRREELLMNSKELDAVWTIRKAFSQLDTSSVTEAIINLLLKTKNNEHFIASINVSFNDKNVFEAMRGERAAETAASQQARAGAGAAAYNSSGYNTGGSSSKYRRPTGYDDD